MMKLNFLLTRAQIYKVFLLQVRSRKLITSFTVTLCVTYKQLSSVHI